MFNTVYKICSMRCCDYCKFMWDAQQKLYVIVYQKNDTDIAHYNFNACWETLWLNPYHCSL